MNAGTLADLAKLDGMPSLPSLQRFIGARPDFPIVQRGRRGLPYILDLAAAAAFVRANWNDGRALDQRRAKRAALAAPLPLFEGINE